MGKENNKKEEKPKKNNLKAFLKKRAPLYLAGITLIIISAHGILTEKGLASEAFPVRRTLKNSKKITIN